MFIVTLSKGRGRGNEGSHACGHVNIQADGIFSRPYSLIDKLGTHLRHKTNIPVLGSKQWLNLQEGLTGQRGLLRAPQVPQRLTPELRASSSQTRRRPTGSRCDGCHPGHLMCCGHCPLCAQSSETIHIETVGTP